jgi:hypothetical protein
MNACTTVLSLRKGPSYPPEENVVVPERDLRSLKWGAWGRVNSRGEATSLPVLSQPLHSMDYVGIDTCSALSVSTEQNDFVYIDRSPEARESVSLRGIGGEQSVIGGRGALVVCMQDENKTMLYMIDPAGVYLDEASSSNLRILGQQRMKKFGFDLVQNKNGDGQDFLVHRSRSDDYLNVTHIPLITRDGILLMKTCEVNFTNQQKSEVKMHVKRMSEDEKEGNLFYFEIVKSRRIEKSPVLIMNEASLTDAETLRLDHWRNAHRMSSGIRHTERCPACEQAKHKSGSFKRNTEYLGTGLATQVVYWRLYCDGFGGQRSMGDESYQGAKGGFVFVCPMSGMIKVKLYASTKQFPAILYQVLQEIESEGYVTREMYVDTYIVNISKEAEDVAAMFKMRIVPVSAGTPQEMAYAERAVLTLAQMSRALADGRSTTLTWILLGIGRSASRIYR